MKTFSESDLLRIERIKLLIIPNGKKNGVIDRAHERYIFSTFDKPLKNGIFANSFIQEENVKTV